MANISPIKQRLAKLEKRLQPTPIRANPLAACGFFETEMGAALLAGMPDDRRDAIAAGAPLSVQDIARAMKQPALSAHMEAFLTAWRKERGLPTRAERDLLDGR